MLILGAQHLAKLLALFSKLALFTILVIAEAEHVPIRFFRVVYNFPWQFKLINDVRIVGCASCSLVISPEIHFSDTV